MPKIVIDVHGVLLDLVGLIDTHLHRVDPWPKGEYNLKAIYGCDPFKKALPYHRMLPCYEAEAILNLCAKVKCPITLASVVYENTDLAAHTVQTLFTVGTPTQDYPIILCPGGPKQDYIDHTEYDLLIDDSDYECQAWSGPTFTVPRPWNNMSEDHDWLVDLKNHLEGWAYGLPKS